MKFNNDTIRFYVILCVELCFAPFLYAKNFILNTLSNKKYIDRDKRRKDVETSTVYVNIHEWGGYQIARKKNINKVREFECGIKFQLERFNNEKKNIPLIINVTLSEHEKHDNLDFIKQHSDSLHYVDNKGMDFSGYSFFYEKMKNNENCYVILTNSSVEYHQQDFLADYIKYFEENKDVGILGVSYCSKMIQTLIRNNFTPHLQSFFYLTSLDVLREIIEKNSDFPGENISHKLLLIREGEIKISSTALNLGYKLAVVKENGSVYKFGKNGFFDNSFNAWKLYFGDVRVKSKFPNRINAIKYE